MAKELEEIDMDFKALDEPWNEYGLDNGITVFVRTVATSISSSKLRDLAGEPLYLVSHQVQTKRHPPI
ncbi:MAG: hypothetical protein WCB79_06040 [Halobacteriota archaeon]